MDKFLRPMESIDRGIINAFKMLGMPVARLALCVVFFWFGILKVVGASPANQLVTDLFNASMPSFINMGVDQFIFCLGLYEMAIGIAFLVPRLERLAIFLLLPHLFVTAAPLALLKTITWQSVFIPTLEGQYIIKNLLIIATAVGVAAHLEPLHHRATRRR
ncbi:MAG: hypothetical protein AAB726_02275 [Patescibacteria group bacterium]